MKAAILIQKAFKEKFEPNALKETFQTSGWSVDIVVIEEITDFYTEKGIVFEHSIYGDLKQYDVLIVREVFSYFKFALTVISYMRSHGKAVIDNNLSTEKMMINKIIDAQRLVAAGLPFPRTYHAHTMENYLKIIPRIEQENEYPVLVKHRSSGKGANIYKLDSRTELEAKLEQLNLEQKVGHYYVQQFLNLKQDFRVLVIADEVVGVMQRIPKEGEFRANFSLGGSVRAAELTPEIKDLATKAARATNCNFAGVDIVYTHDNKPYLLEVNRTPGFEGFSKAYNRNIAQLYVDYASKLV